MLNKTYKYLSCRQIHNNNYWLTLQDTGTNPEQKYARTWRYDRMSWLVLWKDWWFKRDIDAFHVTRYYIFLLHIDTFWAFQWYLIPASYYHCQGTWYFTIFEKQTIGLCSAIRHIHCYTFLYFRSVIIMFSIVFKYLFLNICQVYLCKERFNLCVRKDSLLIVKFALYLQLYRSHVDESCSTI